MTRAHRRAVTGAGASQRRLSRPSPRLVAVWAAIVFASQVGTSRIATFAAAVAPQTTAPQRAADTPTGDLSPEDQAAADERSETTIRAVCLTCHPVENVVRTRRVPSDWDTVVARMATLGARATEEQFRMIRRYLIRYYGTVRVNSAPADEFSAVLGYSPKDAAAIDRVYHASVAESAHVRSRTVFMSSSTGVV